MAATALKLTVSGADIAAALDSKSTRDDLYGRMTPPVVSTLFARTEACADALVDILIAKNITKKWDLHSASKEEKPKLKKQATAKKE